MKPITLTIEAIDAVYLWRDVLKTIQLAVSNPCYTFEDDSPAITNSIQLLIDLLPKDELWFNKEVEMSKTA